MAFEGKESDLRKTSARSILSPVSGFLREAGFTHSLSPARNCTYGCQYCYVPTMGVFGGLRPEDWQKWGQFTTVKSNAAVLAARELRPEQVIYCSPVVDPYQPAERQAQLMPELLESVAAHPPRTFVIQTRGTLILRDLELLKRVARVTKLRVSFSVTTDNDEVRRRYEPRCESNAERLRTIDELRAHRLEVFATLAPLLPCDPEELTRLAVQASGRKLVGDPLHARSVKAHGATTRDTALKIAQHHGEAEWFDPLFQSQITAKITSVARRMGSDFTIGPAGFARLAG